MRSALTAALVLAIAGGAADRIPWRPARPADSIAKENAVSET
jgi:hypothetical protein